MLSKNEVWAIDLILVTPNLEFLRVKLHVCFIRWKTIYIGLYLMYWGGNAEYFFFGVQVRWAYIHVVYKNVSTTIAILLNKFNLVFNVLYFFFYIYMTVPCFLPDSKYISTILSQINFLLYVIGYNLHVLFSKLCISYGKNNALYEKSETKYINKDHNLNLYQLILFFSDIFLYIFLACCIRFIFFIQVFD